MTEIDGKQENLKTENKPRTAKPNFSAEEWDQKIAEAEHRIKALRKRKLDSQRDHETRRKIIAGAGLFKAINGDPDLRAIVIPAIQAELTESDFAYVFGS